MARGVLRQNGAIPVNGVVVGRAAGSKGRHCGRRAVVACKVVGKVESGRGQVSGVLNKLVDAHRQGWRRRERAPVWQEAI